MRVSAEEKLEQCTRETRIIEETYSIEGGMHHNPYHKCKAFVMHSSPSNHKTTCRSILFGVYRPP